MWLREEEEEQGPDFDDDGTLTIDDSGACFVAYRTQPHVLPVGETPALQAPGRFGKGHGAPAIAAQRPGFAFETTSRNDHSITLPSALSEIHQTTRRTRMSAPSTAD
jgi:hypothetical protein